MKKGGFRTKVDKVMVHQAHAEARALGFKRNDALRHGTYKAAFIKRCELTGEWTLHKNVAGDWQARRSHNNWYTPWFETPNAAWVYGCLNNWGEA
ncbi:hypothetical protein [Pseudomonas mediterranea]|uniref:hypothetical protein n=1 Tax=Pseudomonas mediterranea TaxID=183795 RepID=UPI0006D893AF|nr:hypothetical protein [Pseudomonas mediterranea]